VYGRPPPLQAITVPVITRLRYSRAVLYSKYDAGDILIAAWVIIELTGDMMGIAHPGPGSELKKTRTHGGFYRSRYGSLSRFVIILANE